MLLSGVHPLAGTPLNLTVSTKTHVPNRLEATGAGLETAVEGEPAHLEVRLLDCDGRALPLAALPASPVSCELEPGGNGCAEYHVAEDSVGVRASPAATYDLPLDARFPSVRSCRPAPPRASGELHSCARGNDRALAVDSRLALRRGRDAPRARLLRTIS